MKGVGLELVLQAIAECVQNDRVTERLCLPPQAGRLHARLHEFGTVLHEELVADGYWLMDVELSR